MSSCGAGPKQLNSPGNEVGLRDELLGSQVLVFEEGGRGQDNRLLPVLEVCKGVSTLDRVPVGRNTVNKARGVRDQFRGVKGPFLGWGIVDEEKTDRYMVEKKVGSESLSGVVGFVNSLEFPKGLRARREVILA